MDLGLTKDWRIILWIAVVVLSLVLIGPKISTDGMEISSVGKNSTFYGRLSRGDVIYKIATPDTETVDVESEEDLQPFQDYLGYLTLSTSKGDMVVKKDPGETIELTLTEPGSSNIQFGLDLEGGVRVIVKPEDNASSEVLNQIKTTLETRINVYGLKEALITPLYGEGGFVQIEMAGGTEAELMELLEKQGKFEAKIPMTVEFSEGNGELMLGEGHTVEYSTSGNGSVVLKGQEYVKGDHLSIEDIDFEVWNVSEERAVMSATVFTGKDIIRVHFDPKNSYLRRLEKGYEFGFGVVLSSEGAERFATVTKEIPLSIDSSGKEILESKVYFYMDDNLMDALQVSGTLKGKPYTTPMITGGGETKEEALQSKRELQSILRSGSLPTEIEIVKSEKVSPKLGSDFLSNAMFAGLLAIIAVSVIVFVRYRKLKFVLPMSIVSASEVVIIMGAASLINWTIDLAAIAGIIAAVGTSLDSQIIIIDETLKEESVEVSLKAKMKRAFFTIFGAAGTTIGAMLPLMVLGFGMLRGFAITTSIGVLAGIFITRPAFGKIVERVV